MEEYNLIVEYDEDGNWGFNIQFDRRYNILSEKLPISSDLATRIIEDAYTYGYDAEQLGQEVGDKGTVGTICIEDETDKFTIEFSE